MAEELTLPPARQQLLARTRKFSEFTRDEELRSQMWRLGEIVTDRDCPDTILEDCGALYGLVGQVLKARLAALLPELESRVSRNRKSRDRIDAIRVSKSLIVQDKLRDFYFAMSEHDLHTIWNGGENDLPSHEKELVRIALRNKIGIGPTLKLPEICSKCFLLKANCVCERGWW